MSSSEKFKSNAKTSTSTGILFLFYYFFNKSYLKELLRMSDSYKRFKKLKTSKESTQVVTTKPYFYRIRLDRLERLDKYDRLD